MKSEGSICRIGVFYDGSYFGQAQRYFYHDRKIGWLCYQPFHAFLEHFMSTKEQGFPSYKGRWGQPQFSIFLRWGAARAGYPRGPRGRLWRRSPTG